MKLVGRQGTISGVTSLTVPRSTLVRVSALLLLCVSLVVAFAIPRGANAVPAPQQTQITIDPILAIGLKAAGVQTLPYGAAKASNASTFYVPVTSSKVTDAFVGNVKHQGGIKFKIGKLTIALKNFQIVTHAGTPTMGTLSAQLVVQGIGEPFYLPVSPVTVDSSTVKNGLLQADYAIRVDANIAAVINKALKVRLFIPGQAWARASTRLTRTGAPTATPTPTPTPAPVNNAQ
jgi:hypothetical protein